MDSSDNLWPVVTGLILAPVVNEFQFNGVYLTLGQNIGLFLGAIFWGVGSDVWGRRLSFNLTLLITAIFSAVSGASPNAVALATFVSLFSIGVGGNLPVDSAVFLEFVPASHQYLLTVLSVWWALGQLVASLIAWPLIGNFSCPTPPSSSPGSLPLPPCTRASNRGWRYFLHTMGGLMFLLWMLRFFVFRLYESPKYLVGRGRDVEAVEVIRKVAAYNHRDSDSAGEAKVTLSVEGLREAERFTPGVSRSNKYTEVKKPDLRMETSVVGVLRRKLRAVFSVQHLRGLFCSRKMAWSTSLLIILWALVGLAFPLYNAFVPF